MQRVDQSSTKLFADLAAEMDEADHVWHAAAESTFDRLQVANPELAQLAIQALHSRAAAASFFARKFVYANTGNCYAALAHDKRELIVARLHEFIAGEAGSYV